VISQRRANFENFTFHSPGNPNRGKAWLRDESAMTFSDLGNHCCPCQQSNWITHIAIVLILFVAFGWLFAGANRGQGIKLPINRLITMIMVVVFTAGFIIVGFYLIAD
jgi:hypothetical protein